MYFCWSVYLKDHGPEVNIYNFLLCETKTIMEMFITKKPVQEIQHVSRDRFYYLLN